jgi:hypothetical protein
MKGEGFMATATNRTLWWSLVVSLLIYAVVAHVAALPRDPEASLLVLFGGLAALSGGIAVGTLVYRRRALVEPIRRGELDLSSPEGQQKAFQPYIVNLVLSESVGIYGLVLAFLSGRGAYSLPFIGLALVLMFAHRPTASDLAPPLGGGHSVTRPPPIA